MEITAIALQTVATNQNVLFTETAVGANNSMLHREGSGLVTLRAQSSTQCRARFRVSFGGNIAVATGETVGPISLAIAINGEAIASTTVIETPAAVGAFSNVFTSIFLDIPTGCCQTLSVKNISANDVAVDVQNANLIIERVA